MPIKLFELNQIEIERERERERERLLNTVLSTSTKNFLSKPSRDLGLR